MFTRRSQTLAFASTWCIALALADPAVSQGPGVAGIDSTSRSGSAETLPSWARDNIVTWKDVGAGELLWRSPQGLVPLPVVETDVELHVGGIVAGGTITQRFHNPTDHVIEAVYVFPLPETAAVQHMELVIGERRIVSAIKEREAAKRTYERAKSEGKKTALVEEERPNLFTTNVANIDPGLSVDVTLTYVDEVGYDDGAFGLVFPLTFTPRFIPDASLSISEATGAPTVISPLVPDAERVTPPFVRTDDPRAPRARVRVTIEPGVPVRDVECPSHDLVPERSGTAWHFDTGEEPIVADRDVRLFWRPETGEVAETALLTEVRGESRHALIMLVPPTPDDLDAGDGLATTTTFVIDVSGSMAGPSIEQAREALLAAIDRLEPRDRFTILAFANETTVFHPETVEANPANVAHARAWVRRLEAKGGTNMFPALLRAISMFDGAARDAEAHPASETDAAVVRRIVFLTDGAIGNERHVLERTLAGLGDVRLHVIGIGSAPNRYLVRQMADLGHGMATFIASTSGAENGIDRFLTRIDRPVVTDVTLTWEGIGLVESYPEILPDLHAGEPLFVSARLDDTLASGGRERVVFRGRVDGGTVESTLDLADTPIAPGIATRWARAKVSALADRRLGGADPDSIRREIVRLGIDYHLVTPHTSLVAVEELVTSNESPHRTELANALPMGSQLLGPAGGTLPRGGTDRPLHREVAAFLIRSAILLLCARALLGGRRELV